MNPLVQTALRAAGAAARVHRRWVHRLRESGATEKGRRDYVSRVDLEAQEAALEVIRRRHPGHGILAEEEDGSDAAPSRTGTSGGTGLLWVVDPLDGTTNFLHGHPHHTASVALVEDAIPVVGAVVAAPTSERWWAAEGAGAWKDGRRIRVSGTRELESALVGTGFPFKAPELLPAYTQEFDRVLRAASGVRRGGSAALDLCYLASGIFDAFWELHLMPWDVAAGILLVREAGGVVTRLDGGDPGLEAGSILAANSPALLSGLGRVVRDGTAGPERDGGRSPGSGEEGPHGEGEGSGSGGTAHSGE